MSNVKIIVGILASVIAILTLGFQLNKRHAQPKDLSVFTIGILQTASHPALDAAREGFMTELHKQLGESKVEFIVQNGQGSVQQLHTMANSLHANKNVDAIFAIATPAAQAMANVEKHKPIVIAAVTDPHAAGLIQPDGNVCGTRDMVDVASTVQMLTALVPGAKKVALIYNPGEVNSCVMIKKLEAALTNVGIQSIHAGITSESEVLAAISMACKNADVLLAPTDNLVALTLPLIADRALKAKRPLIVSDNELVKQGALAACGIDYCASGQQSAGIVQQVLIEKVKPSEVSIATPACDTVVLNRKVAEALGIVVPAMTKKLLFV